MNNGWIPFMFPQYHGATPKWSRAMINVTGYSVLSLLWHFTNVCCKKRSIKSCNALPHSLYIKLESINYDLSLSYLCILPVPRLGWRVYPCWGLSAPSHSLWKCPWACGYAGQWGSLPSRSCRTKVPAAGCWTRTGCSMTGSTGRSSRSSRCSRRSPGHRAYLRGKSGWKWQKREKNKVVNKKQSTFLAHHILKLFKGEIVCLFSG